MEPEGISVSEIRLGLPNTHYYLRWEPASPPLDPADRRALLGTVRETARRLGWRVFAAGGRAATVQLVFQTSTDNLERGLTALLPGARNHRVYMVQPVAALPLIASCVHQTKDVGRLAGNGRDTAESPVLPDTHYGMFMGERPWAQHMLELLTRCALGEAAGSPAFPSLAELAETHDNSRDAITDAYRSGRFSLKDIAEYFDMHFSEVSAVINASSMNR